MSKTLKRKFDRILKPKIKELVALLDLADYSLTDEVNNGQYNDLITTLTVFVVDEIEISEL